MNVGEALRLLEVREARILLAEASGFSQAALLSSPERALAPDVERRFVEFAGRRQKGEPIAYIVGHKEFYGLDLAVNPAVLIPRPETELLVELALERPFSSALDLGTGCGAIALALKKQRPAARVVAVEASAAALAVAQRNAVRHNLDVEFRHGRWLAAVPGERFAVIVANPPYVAAGDPHLPDLRYEPPSALVSGADGLDDIKAIAAAAPRALEEGGWLYLEHGLGQAEKVRSFLERAGLEEVRTWPDLSGIPRVSGGRR